MQPAFANDHFIVPAEYDGGTDQPETLSPEQERILAEVIHLKDVSGSTLRYAVIPVDQLSGLPVHAALAATGHRSQDYLARVGREWPRRGGDVDGLVRALAAARHELNIGTSASITVTGSSAEENSPDLLGECLSLDRSLIGPARQGPSVQLFVAALNRELARIEKSYPATMLEQLDVVRAEKLAREYFIRAQMPLAMKRACVVRRHSRLPLEDLIQIGNIALMQAVDNFDPRYGAPFAAYAYPWVKQAILRGERQADLVPLAQRLGALRGKVRATAADLTAIGESPEPELIAKRLGLTQGVVAQILRAETPVLSLEGVAGRSLAQTYADESSPAPEEHAQIRERRLAVQAALATCPERERSILCRLFGIGCPAEAASSIARSLHVSPQRVYQIKADEIRRLRRPTIAAHLKDFI